MPTYSWGSPANQEAYTNLMNQIMNQQRLGLERDKMYADEQRFIEEQKQNREKMELDKLQYESSEKNRKVMQDYYTEQIESNKTKREHDIYDFNEKQINEIKWAAEMKPVWEEIETRKINKNKLLPEDIQKIIPIYLKYGKELDTSFLKQFGKDSGVKFTQEDIKRFENASLNERAFMLLNAGASLPGEATNIMLGIKQTPPTDKEYEVFLQNMENAAKEKDVNTYSYYYQKVTGKTPSAAILKSVGLTPAPVVSLDDSYKIAMLESFANDPYILDEKYMGVIDKGKYKELIRTLFDKSKADSLIEYFDKGNMREFLQNLRANITTFKKQHGMENQTNVPAPSTIFSPKQQKVYDKMIADPNNSGIPPSEIIKAILEAGE